MISKLMAMDKPANWSSASSTVMLEAAVGCINRDLPDNTPTRQDPGEPIVLTLYGPDGGAVAVPLLPKRALTLAQELLTRGVQAIKADSWDAMYEQGALGAGASVTQRGRRGGHRTRARARMAPP